MYIPIFCILFVIAAVAFAVVGFGRIFAVCASVRCVCVSACVCVFLAAAMSSLVPTATMNIFWAKKNRWNEIITISVKWDNWWDLNEFGGYADDEWSSARLCHLCERVCVCVCTQRQRLEHTIVGLMETTTLFFGSEYEFRASQFERGARLATVFTALCEMRTREANRQCVSQFSREWHRVYFVSL